MALLQPSHVAMLLQSPTTKAGWLSLCHNGDAGMWHLVITPLQSSSYRQLSLLEGSLYEAMVNYLIGC
ncbi:unnamed protein product, partial [Musa hybrid cultivar]